MDRCRKRCGIRRGLELLLLAMIAIAFTLPLVAFAMAALQLFSVVVAFRTLLRGGQPAPRTS